MRVQGTGPWNVSAWVVPRGGISVQACAHAVANRLCVCAIPPMSLQVRRRVAGRPERALDDRAVGQRNDDHVLGRHAGVGQAGGFDDDQPGLAVDAADVAPGQDDQPVGGQPQVRPADAFLEFFQHGGPSGYADP